GARRLGARHLRDVQSAGDHRQGSRRPSQIPFSPAPIEETLMRLPRNSYVGLARLAILALPAAALSTQQRYEDSRTDTTSAQRSTNRTSDRDRQNSPHLCKFSELTEKDIRGANNEEIGQ